MTEVAIVAIPDKMFGEVGLAVVAVQPGTTLTLDTITEYLDGRLARFKHPRALRLVDALPRNATGKIARGQLRETYSNHATH